MAKRHPNPRLAKIHRNYTVEEIANLFDIHRNTVRNWIKQGLPTTDRRSPLLILGRDLAAFLQRRRQQAKQTCQPGEIYCVCCRMPQKPAGLMADYVPTTAKLGKLIGICPSCERLIRRPVSLAKLAQVRGDLDIQFPQGQEHINERE
jgi:hypothetical protein